MCFEVCFHLLWFGVYSTCLGGLYFFLTSGLPNEAYLNCPANHTGPGPPALGPSSLLPHGPLLPVTRHFLVRPTQAQTSPRSPSKHGASLTFSFCSQTPSSSGTRLAPSGCTGASLQRRLRCDHRPHGQGSSSWRGRGPVTPNFSHLEKFSENAWEPFLPPLSTR